MISARTASRRFWIASLIASVIAALVASIMIPGAFGQSSERVRATVGESGLPLPRFVSLSVDEANMRTGPGQRYPILWVFVRDKHPLEITAEYGLWRRVRDQDGTTGWMHRRLLSGKRTALITGGTRTLRSDAAPDARALLRAEPGVVADIDRCEGLWCRIEIRGKRGWLPREHVWGSYQDEEID